MSTDVPQSAPDLISAIQTFCTALDTAEGQAASGLTPADFAEQTARASALAEALSRRDEALRAYRAAVTAASAAQDAAERGFRPVRRQAANHRGMTPELRALAGLPAPVGVHRGRAPLPEITDLTSLPRPSGSVFLDWTGPTGGALRYEIFALDLDAPAAGWTLIGAASATDFTHRDAVPGARTAYRVQAVRGERRGEVSNETAVHV